MARWAQNSLGNQTPTSLTMRRLSSMCATHCLKMCARCTIVVQADTTPRIPS